MWFVKDRRHHTPYRMASRRRRVRREALAIRVSFAKKAAHAHRSSPDVPVLPSRSGLKGY